MFTALRFFRNAILVKGRRRSDSIRPTRRARLMLEELETRTVPSAVPLASPLSLAASAIYAAGGNSLNSGFTPIQIQEAYGVSALLNASPAINGQGETIGIVDAYNDPTILADANTFSTAYNSATLGGLPTFNTGGPTLTVVNQNGGPVTTTSHPANNAGWATEISLDVEWAHAIAPEANIVLVEASSASDANLMTAVATAANRANVVSMSWGGSEFSGETAYDTSAYFKRTSVAFVASAGDSPGIEWPSSSPYVLAVGGTTLKTNAATGAYVSETAWSSGGGGTSKYEGEPSYQSNDGQSDKTEGRTSPDVSYDANPSSGVAIYDSTNYEGYVGWYGVGGTSAGAPQWSAIVALADQQRGGSGPLNTAQVENTLYGLSLSADATDFHVIGGGYNLQTGLGSPQASALVPVLAGTTMPSTFTTKGPVSGGGGGRGGRFIDVNALAILAASDTFVAAVPASAATPTPSAPSFPSPATPVSNFAPAPPLSAGNAWQSGGGGSDALAGDHSPGNQAAPGATAAPDGASQLPWLGELFTEAVKRLKMSFTEPPKAAPAPPTPTPGGPVPMKEAPAPTPPGKGSGMSPLHKIELYAAPAVVGLVTVGIEREERRRRERQQKKPR